MACPDFHLVRLIFGITGVTNYPAACGLEKKGIFRKSASDFVNSISQSLRCLLKFSV